MNTDDRAPLPSSADRPKALLTESAARLGRLLIGMLVGNAVGALLCVLAAYLITSESPLGTLGVAVGYPSLLLVPFAIGLAAAFVWKPLHLRVGMAVVHSLSCTLVGLGSAWFFMGEGVICLIILSPLLWGGVLAGTLMGRILFRRDHQTRSLCFAPLALLTVVVEPALRGPHTGSVSDEIRIAAPPSRVWPHVLAFDEMPTTPEYWLFRAGLPYPTRTTNEGHFVGASRACHFSGGAVFEEKVVEFETGKRLTFDIVKSPPDPELIGHLDARRGQFELRDNGDGSTTLIGTTWYALHVRPAWYFDWWTHAIFRAVHLHVMNHLQRLAERRE